MTADDARAFNTVYERQRCLVPTPPWTPLVFDTGYLGSNTLGSWV